MRRYKADTKPKGAARRRLGADETTGEEGGRNSLVSLQKDDDDGRSRAADFNQKGAAAESPRVAQTTKRRPPHTRTHEHTRTHSRNAP